MVRVRVPRAEGVRPAYGDLPGAVRRAVEEHCGGRVLAASTRSGGFSPGVACVVSTAAGRFFVKAVSAEANARSPELHRSEGRALAALGAAGVRAPRLVGVVEEGPWFALVLEALPGEPAEVPWRSVDLVAMLAAVGELPRTGVPGIARIDGLQRMRPETWRAVAGGAQVPAVPAWALAHLDRLAGAESRWAEAAAGEALLHLDLRSDNLLLDGGRATLVDWPYAGLGDPVVDLVLAAPAVAMQGGPAPEEFLGLAGWRGDRSRLLPLVAGWAGTMLERAGRPAEPGLEGVRAFQRAQADVALEWLRALLGA